MSRARRRHAGAIVMLGVGATQAAASVANLTEGGVKRQRVRRELSFGPEFGRGFAGASATLRLGSAGRRRATLSLTTIVGRCWGPRWRASDGRDG